MSRSKLTCKYGNQLIAEYSEKISSSKIVEYPLVSVCFQTYNHADFIEEALNSVLIQETSFPFEIVIGDDASTDGTSEIIDRYQREHPDKIKILRSTENLGKYTGNGRLNLIRNLRACRGKYIAFLEGDDYWTDPQKLQKQVDFLESNPDYTASCHRTSVLSEDNSGRNEQNLFSDFGDRKSLDLGDVMKGGTPFHTSSFVVRPDVILPLPDFFMKACSGDLVFYALAAAQGPIHRIPEVMSCYRAHSAGYTQVGFKHPIEYLFRFRQLWADLDRHFDHRFSDVFLMRRKSDRQLALGYLRQPLPLFERAKLFWMALRMADLDVAYDVVRARFTRISAYQILEDLRYFFIFLWMVVRDLPGCVTTRRITDKPIDKVRLKTPKS